MAYFILRNVYINYPHMVNFSDILFCAVPLIGLIISFAILPFTFKNEDKKKILSKIFFVNKP